MIRKISVFIINKRIAILVIMSVLAVVCIVSSHFVEINEDMTKYLPDDSNMKAGLDIMDEAFPETEETNTIRVMFDGLTAEQKDLMPDELGSIPNVDSVDYEADSSGYNRDDHTLYVLNMNCDYGSEEEKAIEAELDSRFSDYTMTWKDDDDGFPPIPVMLLVTALAILLTVLFFMCGSWIEPFLFLVVIGIAVVINGGTNLILDNVAGITNSISAILQLVLSMDYSIILMNRYRQEKALEPDSVQAMRNALTLSFSSIASSALTTVTGLLMLLFMSFKIGTNLGIVLAKGVFISMICVLTMLPGIILACDGLIQKTAKKTLHIPTEWAANFSYKMRRVMPLIFILLFAGSFILQQRAGISYTLTDEDAIAKVFPRNNTVAMIYESRDEDEMPDLISMLDGDENVRSILGYGSLIGKQYTAKDLAESMEDMDEIDEDISLDSAVISMFYYDYYKHGETVAMTASDFLSFVSDTVRNDKTFSEYIDDDMRANADKLDNFADPGALTKPRNVSGLASFFGMKSKDVKDLLLLYYIKHGGVSTGKMKLPAFADFVTGEVAKDSDYKSMFDSSALSKMKQLKTFTNVEKMTTAYSYKKISSMLGVDADKAKLMFVYYYAMSDDYDPGKMTLPDFVDFLQNDIVGDPAFSSFLDKDMSEQIGALALFTNEDAFQAQHSAAELAAMLGIDETMMQTVFQFKFGADLSDKTMSLEEVIGFILSVPMIVENMDEQMRDQLQMAQGLITATESGAEFSSEELAGMLGMDSDMMKVLYTIHASTGEIDSWSVSMHTLINFLTDNAGKLGSVISKSEIQSLSTARKIINASVKGTAYTSNQIASLTGMSKQQARQLYLLYISRHGTTSGWKLSVKNFIDFIIDDVLSDSSYSDRIDAGTSEDLHSARALVNAVISGKAYTADEMSTILGNLTNDLDSSMIGLMYLYANSSKYSDSEWTMSLDTLLDFITENVLQDSRFASVIDSDMRQKLYDAKESLDDGIKQLVSDKYSRMIINTTYPEEGAATTAFFEGLESYGSKNLDGNYYLVGNAAMNYEMQKTFNKELLLITLLTGLAIFTIIAFTFRSLSIPLILVLLVQCGVYITTAITGFMSGSIYYLALLVVECILMGSTVDYGILLTNYYREARGTSGVQDALKTAYAGSIHTIMSSGLILVLVTAAVGGMFNNPVIAAIVRTISMGAFCAMMLILFILPGVLAACDRLIAK